MSSVAKQDASDNVSFLSCLFQGNFYKVTQGRLVRQLTFVGIALVGVLFAWEVSQFELVVRTFGNSGAIGFGIALGAALIWVALRAVNYPRFASFLISVEAELNKVSWPSRSQLWKATGVVIFVIFALAALLFLFDFLWRLIFKVVGVTV